MKIREQRDRNAAKIPGPIGVGILAVHADRHGHGMGFGHESIGQRFQRRNFTASSGCPIEWIKQQQNVVLPTRTAQLKRVAKLVGERKIRCFCSDIDHAAYVTPRVKKVETLGAR